jgi:hypothetical protein
MVWVGIGQGRFGAAFHGEAAPASFIPKVPNPLLFPMVYMARLLC